jgi:ABC-type glutathione transport system ATPase component
MKVVLVRHAEAAPGDPDELRALTPAGHEQARRLGEQLRAEGIRPDAVLTSPLLRARETGADLGFGEPEPVDELSPGATAEDLRAATAGLGETGGRRRPPAGLQPHHRCAARGRRAAVPDGERADPRAVTAIVVEDLRKSYGEHEAVRGITFHIKEGEVFGLLGPNGAGKTTTVEILEGYRERDGGRVDVLGFDPARAEQRTANE